MAKITGDGGDTADARCTGGRRGGARAQEPGDRKPLEAQQVKTAGSVNSLAARLPQPAAKPSATDSLGDPLPAGARLRLGTLRFRPPSIVAGLALSPDETTIVTVGDELIVWDAATGKERWRAHGREYGFDTARRCLRTCAPWRSRPTVPDSTHRDG